MTDRRGQHNVPAESRRMEAEALRYEVRKRDADEVRDLLGLQKEARELQDPELIALARSLSLRDVAENRDHGRMLDKMLEGVA